MMIHETSAPEPSRELRVAVGLRYHLGLRKVKVLTGKTMSATLEDALDAYFSSLAEAA